jgi:hypothetical protein
MAEVKLIDKTVSFDEDTTDNKLIIHHSHDLPDDYISALKRDKIDTLHTHAGDFFRIATIPTGIVEAWQREGFDIHKESASAIINKIKKHDMDAFITTTKSI